MDEPVVHQTEHMTTIEASAVSQQVQQVHLVHYHLFLFIRMAVSQKTM